MRKLGTWWGKAGIPKHGRETAGWMPVRLRRIGVRQAPLDSVGLQGGPPFPRKSSTVPKDAAEVSPW